jgi:hypothetical protein
MNRNTRNPSIEKAATDKVTSAIDSALRGFRDSPRHLSQSRLRWLEF